MNHGSLFSGIGGFDLAAEWAGWENKFHCEWNEFGQRVLKHYWPDAICYGDITKTDFTIWRGKIDVLTGGFPCQPYSQAGKRLGKEDERHLWPEMLRAIREIQPRYVVGENVPGLINWSGGMVFEEVQSDLEAAGYEVIPFILPAAGVNAPHRRERVWFVAYSNHSGNSSRGCGIISNRQEGITEREHSQHEYSGQSDKGTIANTNSSGLQTQRAEQQTTGTAGSGIQWDASYSKREGLQKPEQGEQYEQLFNVERNDTQNDAPNAESQRQQCEQTRTKELQSQTEQRIYGGGGIEYSGWFEDFPTVSPIHERNDGISDRLSGITFSKWRNESVKACGNAIVPQVVYQIFKAINEYESI